MISNPYFAHHFWTVECINYYSLSNANEIWSKGNEACNLSCYDNPWNNPGCVDHLGQTRALPPCNAARRFTALYRLFSCFQPQSYYFIPSRWSRLTHRLLACWSCRRQWRRLNGIAQVKTSIVTNASCQDAAGLAGWEIGMRQAATTATPATQGRLVWSLIGPKFRLVFAGCPPRRVKNRKKKSTFL